jgi:hypothetical protein
VEVIAWRLLPGLRDCGVIEERVFLGLEATLDVVIQPKGNAMISRQAPVKCRTAMLEQECLRLRLAGFSHREIAAQLGAAPSSAYKRVRHALDEVNKRNLESAEQLRALELLRLDELLNALWGTAIVGDGKAVDRVLKVMERRAKLLGLDAPFEIKTDGQIHIKVIDLTGDDD